MKVEVTSKYSTVDTLRQQYLFIPAKHKVSPPASPTCCTCAGACALGKKGKAG